MSKNWIIEVLVDLRGFAVMNDLPTLAEQLDEAIVVALAEVTPKASGPAQAGLYGAKAGRLVGTARQGNRPARAGGGGL